MISAANYQRMPQLMMPLGPAVLLLASGTMLVAYLISRYLFDYRRKIALTFCIETGVQNAQDGANGNRGNIAESGDVDECIAVWDFNAATGIAINYLPESEH